MTYLYPKDNKAAEHLAKRLVSEKRPDAVIALNKAEKTMLQNGTVTPVADEELYMIVVNPQTFQMLKQASELSLNQSTSY